MARSPIQLRILSNTIRAISKGLPSAAIRAVEQTADRIASRAINRGHVITTSMIQSVYINGPRKSDYAERQMAALLRNPRMEREPEVPRPPGITAVVAVGAGHGVDEEFGNRFHPPHPWFYQAAAAEGSGHAQRVARELEAEVARHEALFTGLRSGG